MRHVSPVRAELGFRTIFNLLGPLSNPAGAQRQLLGVFAPQWVEPLARALAALGSERAWVVHGAGLDEITTTGETQVAELRDGAVRTFTLVPETFGLSRVGRGAIRGGSPAENAQALRDLFQGARGAYRDIVLLNAAAAFVIGDVVEDLEPGLTLAAEVIDNGRAQAALDRLIEVCPR